VFKCSKEEAQRYFGLADVATAASAIQALGCRLAIVTDGPNGAYYATGRHQGHEVAPTAQVVDTTGAGDAFMAGLLFALTRPDADRTFESQENLIRAIQFGCLAGASAVTKLGAVTALPRLWLGEGFPVVGQADLTHLGG
jgi:fructokinase